MQRCLARIGRRELRRSSGGAVSRCGTREEQKNGGAEEEGNKEGERLTEGEEQSGYDHGDLHARASLVDDFGELGGAFYRRDEAVHPENISGGH